MRLLHVTHQYRPAIGGAERYITDLSEELVRRGHHVDVYTSRATDYRSWRNELPPYERLNGVDVHRFRSLPRGKIAWGALSYGMRHYWPRQAARYEPFLFYGSGPICPGMFKSLWQHVREYDVVHINHLHYSHAAIACAGALLQRCPMVITPHIHTEKAVTYDIGYLRTILKSSNNILTDTGFEKEFLAARGWNSEITVAGVGLQLNQFPPLNQRSCRAQFGLPEQGFTMLYLGRKTEYKGLDICLEAFLRLRALRRDVSLLAVGPETDFSRGLWQRYSGQDGLVVHGAITDNERLAALASSDVLVMPSTEEAFGIVYLEAWAYGKPVIAANIPTVASLIEDSEEGFLINPTQVEQLVERLVCLAVNPAIARSMGNRGRAKLERRYTVERIADIVEGVCARVIRRHKYLPAT